MCTDHHFLIASLASFLDVVKVKERKEKERTIERCEGSERARKALLENITWSHRGLFQSRTNSKEQQTEVMSVKIPLNWSDSFTVQMSSDGKTGFKVEERARADTIRQWVRLGLNQIDRYERKDTQEKEKRWLDYWLQLSSLLPLSLSPLLL